MKMSTKIRHIGLVVPNLKKSLNFWCKKLGFKIFKKLEEEGPVIDAIIGYKNVKLKTVKISDKNGNLIELLYFKNPPIEKKKLKWKGNTFSKGFTHLALKVQNIDRLYKNLRKNGIKFNSEPKISNDGKAKLTYCRTPEGVFLELVQIKNENR